MIPERLRHGSAKVKSPRGEPVVEMDNLVFKVEEIEDKTIAK